MSCRCCFRRLKIESIQKEENDSIKKMGKNEKKTEYGIKFMTGRFI